MVRFSLRKTPIKDIKININQSDMALSRVNEVDLLRFIAVMLAVLFHYFMGVQFASWRTEAGGR